MALDKILMSHGKVTQLLSKLFTINSRPQCLLVHVDW